MIERLSIYPCLPVHVQDWLCNIEGWRIQRSRYDKEFSQFLQRAEGRILLSKQDLEAQRNERLHHFVDHCARTVPYYRNLFKRLGICSRDIRTIEDLHLIPIMNKKGAHQNFALLLSESIPKSQRISVHTSGTTGSGLEVICTPDSIKEQRAIWWRYRRRYGLRNNTWCAFFGGRPIVPITQTTPPFWRSNHAGRQILFSAYHMSKSNMGAYIGELRRRRAPWIHSYPSLLTLLASYMIETGTDLGYDVRWLTTCSESLLVHQAEIIRRAFGMYPKQHYAMVEGVANFSECEQGRLHVDEDFAAVEFIPCVEGTAYKVVGTNFSNLALPLLRYDTQDIVTLAESSCPCGNPGRVVSSIDGRNEDYILLVDGRMLGRLDYIFKHVPHIYEAQLRQTETGHIVVLVVRGDHYSQRDEAVMLNELYRHLGPNTPLSVEYRNSLERSPNGKLRFVISLIRESKG